jgi:hypothetical protein
MTRRFSNVERQVVDWLQPKFSSHGFDPDSLNDETFTAELELNIGLD